VWSVPGIHAARAYRAVALVGGWLAAYRPRLGVRHRIFTLRV